ncbi:hypothetical protein D3C71_1283500 [compost metagenome]
MKVPFAPRLVGKPSNRMLSIGKPRALKLPESPVKLPFCMTSPVIDCTASSRVVMPRSSICWRVSTLTDCGVSRSDRFSLVAVLLTPVVYEPLPSVVASRPAVTDTPSMVCSAAGVAGACCAMAGRLAARHRAAAACASGRNAE